jgi:hypothetical protein
MDYIYGQKDIYEWFEFCDTPITIGYVIDKLSGFMIDKYLAIASCDHSPYKPSDKERKRGWTEHNEIAYSPKLTRKELKRLSGDDYYDDNYHEWYIFETKSKIGRVKDYVNFIAFTLRDRRKELEMIDQTWDRKLLESEIEISERLQTDFWKSIEDISPLTYIADGERFLIVTRDEKLIVKLKELVAAMNIGHMADESN